ncbi:MAG: hypothetical protein J5J06_05485 [Phycisphaerae bacterium]|nr:hypothetical protein [Phycisphaerae bacterium]
MTTLALITVLSLLGYLACVFGEAVAARRVEIRCRCGRKTVSVYVVDACDAERIAQAFSEWCPGCRDLRRVHLDAPSEENHDHPSHSAVSAL